MDRQRLSVELVFLQAVQQEPAKRQAFLDATCADDQVRTRVEALLKAHDSAGDFLDGPAVQPSPLAETQRLRTSHADTTSSDVTLDFLEPSSTPGRLGLLAHYEIVEILGRGGMGIVLRGVDVKLNRVVAIKMLAPHLAANAMARHRFRRESQAAAAVSHDHVITIHAVDECKGVPYLVMECIAGPSLQQKIDDAGALALAQILRIGMQIASGLAAAHACGLVHRDIKPANILLENGIERVKITDFGLARSVDDVRMTQAGTVYGTPQYMSPEQAQGERVDQRSDLFSLGSVMYAMSTGRPPFRGDSGLSVLKRVCDDTPRPIPELNPDVPEAVTDIVNRLLAKDPSARFQSAAEVAESLGRLLAELQQHGRVGAPRDLLPVTTRDTTSKTEQWPARGRRWMMPAAAILLSLVGLGLTEATGVTNVRSSVIRLFSPDGMLVVEVDDPGVSVSIDGEDLVITGTGAKEIRLKPGQYKLVASKDGKRVSQELVSVTKNGRQVVRVTREGVAVGLAKEQGSSAAPVAKAVSADKAVRANPSPNGAVARKSTTHPAGLKDRPVKVFVMAGDSNMAGRAEVALLKSNPARTKELFQHLIHAGEWVVRDDVWVKNLKQKGNLTVGFGNEPHRFGPELEFGHMVGDHFDEQVLLIKTCYGGHILPREFRSPRSGLAPPQFLAQLRDILQRDKPNPTAADVEARCGATYREMLEEIRETLANLGEHFPAYQGQGFEMAGFVWFQGFTDMLASNYSPDYAELLANFIRDVRADLKAPGLPFVIGQLGFRGGCTGTETDAQFRAALVAAAQLREFAGNVKLVETDSFWDHEADAVYKKGWATHRNEWDTVGSDHPYHLLGSAKTNCQLGKAFAQAMLELLRPAARK